MNKRLLYALPVALVAIVVAAWLLWPQPKVTVKTGTIVMCTEGEKISDDTRTLHVSADEVGNFGVKTKVETCERHRRLAELREQTDVAIAAGNLEAARKALEEIVSLDPSDRDAAERLELVKAGKKPSTKQASSGSSDGQTPVENGTPDDETPADDPAGETPTGPNASLLRYVPDALTGFVAQGIVDDPFVLWRDYVPAKAGDVLQLVIMAEQHGSPSEAQAAINRDVKTYYPDTSSSVSVAGRTAYFGTRDRLAVIALTDGSVRLVFEATAESESGATLKSLLTNAANEVLK